MIINCDSILYASDRLHQESKSMKAILEEFTAMSLCLKKLNNDHLCEEAEIIIAELKTNINYLSDMSLVMKTVCNYCRETEYMIADSVGGIGHLRKSVFPVVTIINDPLSDLLADFK